MAIVGIDLGTTNSLIGCFRDGKVELIPNRLGELLTPSVVAWYQDGIVVGKIAKEVIATTPQNGAGAFKRFMGTDKNYLVGPHTMTAVELSALVLKSLVEDAEYYLGENIEEAIISVPAYFNDLQRKATIESAKIAGIRVERLINEPTAAAVAYQMHDKNNETVLGIVDLGGGTFDVSILDIFDSVIEVRAVAGDNYLGGEDFDKAIVDYLLKQLKIEDQNLTPELLSKIKYAAEGMKKTLSFKEKAIIEFEINEKVYSCQLSTLEMEKILTPVVEKMKVPLKKAISDSLFKISDIDDIILVGGSTRMPFIKKFVSKLFGKLPLCHLNPDEVVAYGATVASAMKSKNIALEDTVLTDVCPYTLGVAVMTELMDGSRKRVFDPIIERNTTIPTSISRLYCNLFSFQNNIKLYVYQGESIKLENNLELGFLEIAIPKGPEGTVRVEVRFTYDINGIFEVELKSLKTGTTEKKILINANSLSDEDIEKRMESLAAIKIHPRDDEENKMLLSKGEHLYEMALGHTRTLISTELHKFEVALNSQNFDTIKRGKKIFKDFLSYMEALD